VIRDSFEQFPEKLREFFKRLEGPEGCNFRKNDKDEIIWNCAGGTDQSLAIAILTDMGIGPKTQSNFLALCYKHGGHCDCEILFNAEERIMAAYPEEEDEGE